jgi:hypothetical protein
VRSKPISIDALERQLAALIALVEELTVPPAPTIETTNEAHAVRQFLVACARGEADDFLRQQKRNAALVAMVTARCGVACGVEHEVDASETLSAGVG